jgi:energy-coupling factor transporter transmembrane protein EcfT
VLGWQTGAANTAFLAGSQIQGLIALNKPDYTFEPWHGTLLVFAVSAFNVVFNTFLVKKLPLIEAIILVVHICGFFAILVVLWVTGPIGDAHATFTTFNDYGGWNNLGLATLSGLVAVILPLLGADAAVHMSEELRDASKTLPRSMLWTTFVNGSMGFVMLVTFCSVLGSIDDALASPTKQAYLYVFYNSTQSVAGASVMGALVISMAIFCNLSITATSSRQLFAFARDQGIPFSSTFAYVSIYHRKWSFCILTSTGCTQMGRTNQRHLPLVCSILPAIADQSRLLGRPHEHCIAFNGRNSRVVHRVHRLHHTQENSWRATSSFEVQARPCRPADQHCVSHLPGLHLHILFHADGTEAHTGRNELEYPDVWKHHYLLIGILCRQRQARICRASSICTQSGVSKRNGEP